MATARGRPVMYGPTTVRGALLPLDFNNNRIEHGEKNPFKWDGKTPPMNSGDVFFPCELGLYQ